MSDDPANWSAVECERNGVEDPRITCADCDTPVDPEEIVTCLDDLDRCFECAMSLANDSDGRSAA